MISKSVANGIVEGSKTRMFSYRSLAWKCLLVLIGNLVLLPLGQSDSKVAAQQKQDPQLTAQMTARNDPTDDGRYRIGPGDVLEIRVLKAPELSRESVRVDQRGMIRMPLLKNEIKAACLTEAELSQAIATLYLEYKRNPYVDIFVKEFESQPVAIVGSVNNVQPEGTQFKLQRRMRLLELLTLAGGLSKEAGQTINVVHGGGPGMCEEAKGASENAGDLGGLASYKAADTMKGIPAANPVLRPGDIVVVPKGDEIYVVGNVIRPSTIPLRDPITVSKAIAMAGGTAPNTKKSQVRIVRQLPGVAGKKEIFVDLAAIEKQKAEDVNLLPNDIVDVPISGTKAFLKSLMGAVAPAVSQMPVRVVP